VVSATAKEDRAVPIRVTVDLDKCIAAGQCVPAAPEVFDQNEEDGLVLLLDEHPGDDQAAAVRQAARLCPARAIEVFEE
jgi:ferredoxin